MRSEFEDDDVLPTFGNIEGETESSDFGEINLGNELTDQLARAKRILQDVEDNPEEKGSSKAALLNSINQIISKMVAMRLAVWNAERLKIMETTLIECLKAVDPKLTDEFLALYEAKLEHLKAS